MKTTGSLIGGQLKNDPAVHDAYARYLARFVQSCTAAGYPGILVGTERAAEPQPERLPRHGHAGAPTGSNCMPLAGHFATPLPPRRIARLVKAIRVLQDCVAA